MTTRFLLDECAFLATANFLRKSGFDAMTINELGHSGVSDDKVFELAREEDRMLLTFDKDFSNIFRFPLGKHPGIIIVRIHPQTIEVTERLLRRFLELTTEDQYRKALVVIDETKIRIRKGSEATLSLDMNQDFKE